MDYALRVALLLVLLGFGMYRVELNQHASLVFLFFELYVLMEMLLAVR